MIPRKQRILLMILIPVLAIIIIGIILAMLILNTDFLKSNDKLFMKYFAQNFETIENITSFEELDSYQNILESSNYDSTTNVTISNINDENKNIKYESKGNIDNSNNKAFSQINIKENENNVINFDYLKQNNIYGIRLLNLKQYIMVENNNLKDLGKNLGLDDNAINYIPDSIDFEGTNSKIQNIRLTSEEINTLYNKYFNISFSNISKEKFSKQKNAMITVNNNSINANAYKLTLTKEEFNNIVINVLEELKNDQILLSKIDAINNIISTNDNNGSFDLKKNTENLIEGIINSIKDNNIGTEQIVLTVYEYKGKLVRTTIENNTNQITIDVVKDQVSEKISIANKDITNESQNNIEILKGNNGGEISYNIKSNVESSENNKSFEASIVEAKVDNTINSNFALTYSNNDNGINLKADKIINLGNVSEIKNIEDSDKILVNKLNSEQLQQLSNVVAEKISTPLTELVGVLTQIVPIKTINSNDGFLNATNSDNITDLQKNRFNSQFEVYQGEKVKAEEVKQLIEVIQQNLKGIEVKDSNTLNILIEKNNTNKDLAEKIQKVIGEDYLYNVKIKYDDSTGLVNEIEIVKVVEN